jgi:guanine deaminase
MQRPTAPVQAHAQHVPAQHVPAGFGSADTTGRAVPAQHQPAQHQPVQHQPPQHQPPQHQPPQHQPAQHQPAGIGFSLSEDDHDILTLAIELAVRSVADGGGPFGAVAVSQGLVLGMGTNEVSRSFDPTGHAEIVALRAASRRLGRTDLRDCVLYANCEPCPMCQAALRAAGVPRVVHASTRASALATCYADEVQYESLAPVAYSSLLVQQAWLDRAAEPFAAWRAARTA